MVYIEQKNPVTPNRWRTGFCILCPGNALALYPSLVPTLRVQLFRNSGTDVQSCACWLIADCRCGLSRTVEVVFCGYADENFTKYAQDQPIHKRLEVEERTGVMAAQIVKNRKTFAEHFFPWTIEGCLKNKGYKKRILLTSQKLNLKGNS